MHDDRPCQAAIAAYVLLWIVDYGDSQLELGLFRSILSWRLANPTFECVSERADLAVSQ